MSRAGIQFLLISGLGEDPRSSNVVSKGALKCGALNNVAEEEFVPIEEPQGYCERPFVSAVLKDLENSS